MSLPAAQLIQQPAGKTLEFKRDLSSPRPLLKTLIAFANSAGGRLVIDLADDGALVGVEHPLSGQVNEQVGEQVMVVLRDCVAGLKTEAQAAARGAHE